MSQRFRSAFAAPTGFVAAVTRAKPATDAAAQVAGAVHPSARAADAGATVPACTRLAA